MLRVVIAVICCICLSPFAQSQEQKFSLIRTVGKDFVDFSTDNLGNVYGLTSGNQLKKIGLNGDSLGVYNDVRKYGKLFSVDASNPLRLVLFYKDFGIIVLLDRFLNLRATINLRALNIFQVRAICQSYDNGIWIYDEQEAKLKKLNEDGVVSSQSTDFRTFMDPVPVAQFLADENKLVYLYDPLQGLFTFDYYGTLKNKVALLGWKDLQVLEGRLYGRKGDSLVQYAPGSLNLQEEIVPGFATGTDKFLIGREYVYSLKSGAVNIYAIKK
jgi:hypothetical protein